MKQYWFEICVSIVLLLFLGLAIYHQSQIDDLAVYRNRRLIMMEFVLLLIAGVSLVGQSVRCLIPLFRGELTLACQRVGFGFVILVSIIIAMRIDSQTLLYAT